MLAEVIPILKKYPFSGVGSGNFLFFLKYSHFHQWYYEDLPLNHYLLVFAETGIPGLLLFLIFLALVVNDQRTSGRLLVFAAMLVALFFNQFFWFPEIAILFWILSAFGGRQAEHPPPSRKTLMRISVALMLMCIVGNVLRFHSLHPLTWAEEKKTGYDYGFWYGEASRQGTFRWTKERAATFVGLDRNGFSRPDLSELRRSSGKDERGKAATHHFLEGETAGNDDFFGERRKGFFASRQTV